MINYYDEWSQEEIIDISKQNIKYFSKLDTKEVTKREYLNNRLSLSGNCTQQCHGAAVLERG